jgi:putative endonuclease
MLQVRHVIRHGATSDDVASPSGKLMLEHYVYILKLANGQLYTGYTGDLKRRMREHESGESAFTSQRRPLKLIHAEAYLAESDARRREKFMKTTEGKRLLRQQIRDALTSNSISSSTIELLSDSE